MTFQVGDVVVLVGAHTSGGHTYTRECTAGSIGTVQRAHEDNMYIKWSSHPDGFESEFPTSNVDNSCLRLVEDKDVEAELDAEAARLFGLKPVNPASHCPTCTCEEI